MSELFSNINNTNNNVGKKWNINRYNFITNLTEEELLTASEKARNLPAITLYGEFIDQEHYLDSVDLLMSSTRETEHRNEILFTKILPRIKSFKNLLDIGVGNGVLTKDIGQYFTNITVVDNSISSLNNLPDCHWHTYNTIDKIHGSIIDVDIPNKKYDLIILSHVIYYIPLNIRIFLINKLHSYLSKEGIILVIFNEGESRYELTKNFSGTSFEFKDIKDWIVNNYKNVEIIESKELIVAKDLITTEHIAGVCLCDASTTATKEELSEYLNKFHYDGTKYHIEMIQNIILIGELNDYSKNKAINLAKYGL